MINQNVFWAAFIKCVVQSRYSLNILYKYNLLRDFEDIGMQHV